MDPSDPKYAPEAQQARQNVMVGVSTFMTILGVTFVALRIYTRGFIVRRVYIEDWIMVAAATLTVVFLLELLIGAKEFKLGFSGLSLTRAQMVSNIKLILAIIVTYKTTVTLIKISILLFYIRLAISSLFATVCKSTIALLLTYHAILLIIIPTQCRPLEKLWDFDGKIADGTCIDSNVFYHATSSFHILLSLLLLILPLKLLFHIPRPPREIFALYVIFFLGVLSTTASVVRLQSLRVFTLSNDPFYDALPINTWSMVEVNVGIVCACVPGLRPLLGRRGGGGGGDVKKRGEVGIDGIRSGGRSRGRGWAGRYKWVGGRRGKADAGNETERLDIFQTGKDLLISLHLKTMTKTGTVDDEAAPVPPPKDDKYVVGRGRGAEGVRYPEMVHVLEVFSGTKKQPSSSRGRAV